MLRLAPTRRSLPYEMTTRASAHSECPYAAHAGPDELVRFGHALQNDGRLDAAAGCYARTTRLHPAFADGWFEHGLVLQSLGGDLATAVRTFETGLRLRPSDAGRLNAHGVMLQTAGRHAEARRAYSRSVRVPPGLPPARRPPLARAPPSHPRRAPPQLARAPSNAEAYFNLGTLHEALGAPADALAACAPPATGTTDG